MSNAAVIRDGGRAESASARRLFRNHPGDVRCQRQPGCAPSWIKPAYRECLCRL